jgi:uncharacterized protein (TIGR02328 family)
VAFLLIFFKFYDIINCKNKKRGKKIMRFGMIYDEHNDEYLKECIDNLRGKGVDVSEMEGLLNGND